MPIREWPVLRRWLGPQEKPRVHTWTVPQLHWAPDGALTHRGVAHHTCPLCQAAQAHAAVLTLSHEAENGNARSAWRCAECASLFFIPPEISSFHDFGGENELFWRRYIEIGAGLFEMIWPLACLPHQPQASLLDVGCGMGFTLDYWQICRKGEAVGAETAAYGGMGKKLLGVNIHPAYLHAIAELRENKFDVVYASEVIEHVPDAAQFVAELSAHLKPQGVLVLTTPDAAFIRPENDPSVVLAALSPGFHAFLFSKARLENLLRQAGFAWVHLESTGERLIAWASQMPVSRATTVNTLRTEYRGYLATRLQQLDRQSPLWGGLAYRQFKEAVNAGDWETARSIWPVLEQHIHQQWGPHALDAEHCLADAQKPGTLDALATHYPYYLPVLCYYRAMFTLVAEQNTPAAIQLFKLAFELACLWAGRDSAAQLETLAHIWNARAQQIFALLTRHEDTQACALLEEMLAARGLCEQRWGFAIASPEWIAATLTRAYTESNKRGHFETANRCAQMLKTLRQGKAI